MRIKFSKKYFTKTFYKLQNVYKRFVILYGGSGSSKSYSLHQKLIIDSFSDKYDTLVIRKRGSTLRNSVFKGIKDRINAFKLNEYFTFVYSNDNRAITNISSGRQMIFTGIDDPEKIKSVELIGKVYIEEANELNKGDFLELNRRLRGKQHIQFFILFNPVSIYHWLKLHFFDNSVIRKDTEIIHTTYNDNHFMTEIDIEQLENLKFVDENDYKIYALGEWGNPSKGLVWKFTKDFDILKERQNKIYYSHYTEIPENEYFIIYGLDFGGGGTQLDEVDGSSKTVLKRYSINKNKKEIYHELLLYRGFISNEELISYLKDHCGDGLILADNARSDKITEIQNNGIAILGAKTKEGKSSAVSSGYDVLKYWNHYIFKNSIPENAERENHRWEVNPRTDILTGQPEDKFKDITDCDRYAIVYYHLNYIF